MNKKSHRHAETTRDGSPGTSDRAGGRPRSPEADRAIIDAAVRLLTEEGYGRMCVERVAAEAGVGKSTVYRRYRDRQDLAASAISHMVADHAFFDPDTGNTRLDLLQSLDHLTRAAGSGVILSMLGTVMAEQQCDPTLLERFWERVFAPHRVAMLSILKRGVRRGEVRPGVALEAVGELVVGAFLARHLSGLAVTAEWIEAVVATVWDGIGSSRSGDA
jgi:AcrR family transcriptional regulator